MGQSDIGVVYKARDLRLQRSVALRIVMRDVAHDPLARARLNRESTALAALDHPNVAPIYEAGEQDGMIYIASRWIDGIGLGTLVRREGPLSARRAVRILTQVASALQVAHGLGIIHRGVKPSSILVTSTDHAYLTDFGVARRLSDLTGLTVQEQLHEKFDYVAPEYIAGTRIDARVDIYGLGCSLYEALTAEVPYPTSGAAGKMYAHASAQPASPRRVRSEVPERLDAVVQRALAKDPADRQQSPAEFALEAAGAVDLSAPLWASNPSRHVASRNTLSRGAAVIQEERRQHRDDQAPDVSSQRPLAVPAGATVPARERSIAADVAVAPEESAVPVRDYYEPVFFLRPQRRARRVVLWALAVALFLAAPLALLLSLPK